MELQRVKVGSDSVRITVKGLTIQVISQDLVITRQIRTLSRPRDLSLEFPKAKLKRTHTTLALVLIISNMICPIRFPSVKLKEIIINQVIIRLQVNTRNQ